MANLYIKIQFKHLNLDTNMSVKVFHGAGSVLTYVYMWNILGICFSSVVAPKLGKLLTCWLESWKRYTCDLFVFNRPGVML